MGSAVSVDNGCITSSVDSPHENMVDHFNAEVAPTPATIGEKTEVPAEGNES